MLFKTKNTTIDGRSTIGDRLVMNFQAQIVSDDIENISFNYFVVDSTLYKNNRETCLADQVEFEDYVYSVQAELMAEFGNVEEEQHEE